MKKLEHKPEHCAKEKSSPFENRDLNQQLRFPTLSWSSLTQFRDWDKEEWYQRYVLGIKGEPNQSMLAGSYIGEQWATNPDYLPEIERPEIFEAELRAVLPSGVGKEKIHLIGHLDGLSLKEKKKLFEMKTALSNKKWTSSSVQKHQQIDFYLTLLWLNFKIKPEDFEINLIYVPVKQNGDFTITKDDTKPPVIIPTTRTMRDIVKFCLEIQNVYKEMLEFVAQKSII